jgi:hypothetical protein
MTNDEIKQLAYAQDHGSAKEWCFTGESLLAFARALESRVLATAEQDRIDAERWRHALAIGYISAGEQSIIDADIVEGASK